MELSRDKPLVSINTSGVGRGVKTSKGKLVLEEVGQKPRQCSITKMKRVLLGGGKLVSCVTCYKEGKWDKHKCSLV